MSKKEIFYSLIARNRKTVLVEYTPVHGNFQQVTRTIVSKIKPNTRQSYDYSSTYMFHYINENNTTFLCLAHAGYKPELAYQYLDDIKSKFEAQYDQETIHSSIDFAMNNRFRSVLKNRMVMSQDLF